MSAAVQTARPTMIPRPSDAALLRAELPEARNLVLGRMDRRAGWAAPEGKLISAVGKVERLW